jgi:uncharacterized membrane protein YidH (DUF202 family)
MNALVLLLIAGGLLALLAMLLGVVALARKFDGNTDAADPTAKTSAGSLAATLATLAAQAGATQAGNEDKTEKSSSAKQVVTGIAIIAGVLMLIVGIVAGDG